MAKELPYFKFEPSEWENGNIQMLSREDKGLFIDLCSMYWSRLGNVPLKLVIQKLCGGNANALNPLCEENIIQVIDDNIFINFLSEQLNEFEDKSSINSENALKGWEKRRKIKALSESNANALNPQSEIDAIREDKIREDKIKEDKKDIVLFDDFKENSFIKFWDLYNKKQGLKKCEEKFMRLPKAVIEKILEVLPTYIKSTPEVKFRKMPITWLNNESWNDEIQILKTNANEQFTELTRQIRESGFKF